MDRDPQDILSDGNPPFSRRRPDYRSPRRGEGCLECKRSTQSGRSPVVRRLPHAAEAVELLFGVSDAESGKRDIQMLRLELEGDEGTDGIGDGNSSKKAQGKVEFRPHSRRCP